jgi:hypothetical protein
MENNITVINFQVSLPSYGEIKQTQGRREEQLANVPNGLMAVNFRGYWFIKLKF